MEQTGNGRRLKNRTFNQHYWFGKKFRKILNRISNMYLPLYAAWFMYLWHKNKQTLKSVLPILSRLYQLSTRSTLLAKTEFATLFLTHVIKQFPRKKASVKDDSVDEWSFCLCFLNESHYILSICICFFQKKKCVIKVSRKVGTMYIFIWKTDVVRAFQKTTLRSSKNTTTYY